MSLLAIAKSVTALSQIEIDIDKDWDAKEILNIGSIVAGMTHGDFVYYDGSILARLPAGSPGHNLQCLGPGKNPRWS
ncbi:hypothetical protein [Dehalococcoides mccartyi]|uniref:hypothetical protein n=1 Tax=Dehalococcoides mccartyi TaxID=61435 RepID=UPI0002B76B13|nr:hypothetical protein [Dehalococcoides mccartyi]AGG07369.1 hypothetical protein btf_260 [Dehalococcoides mccartyi BTF08]AQW61802.1 hypothetical protein B1779_00485 [Dehalococcoides mccartyi]